MDGATVQEIHFPADAGRLTRGLLVRPPLGDGPWPGLLLLHELVGFRDAGIRQIAKRFAEEGYVALIPDLYDRPGPAPLCILRMVRSLRKGRGQGFRDLEAARRWLAGLPEVDTSRFGVAGFCLGGGFALLYAVRAPVGVAAVFYGDVPDTADALEGVCPVLASYGGKDRVFRAKGGRLKRHLEEIDVPHDLKIYPNAGHAFMDRPRGLLAWILRISPFRVAHDEEASEDSWRRMLAFFQEHLGRQAADQTAAAERRLR
jgi:carboxymethylenebutenolidase